MTKFFSRMTGGFYESEINDEIPADAVEIDQDAYKGLIEGQALGKSIVADQNGCPILVDRDVDGGANILAVTMRQARLALLAAGKLDAVDAAISAMTEPQRSAAKIEWDYAATVEKDSPLIQSLAPQIGISPSQLTDLFNSAALL